MSNNPLSKKSTGLGDTVEKAIFIASFGKLTAKKEGGCGCQKRKELLNKILPYGTTETPKAPL